MDYYIQDRGERDALEFVGSPELRDYVPPGELFDWEVTWQTESWFTPEHLAAIEALGY